MNKLLKQAFTLIELLVVIAIIGILSGLIIVGMSGITQKATIAKAQVFSNSLRSSLMLNLVSEWRFDEGTGQGASDTWGGTNNGMIGSTTGIDTNDPTWTTSGCIYGNCLSFDGTNDYVDMGDPTNGSLDFGIRDFTIGAWVYPSVITSIGMIATKGNIDNALQVGNEGYALRMMNNVFYFHLQDADEDRGISSSEVTINTWYYLVGVADRDGILKLYVNGILQLNQDNISSVGNIDNVQNFRMGSYTNNPTYANFNGKIDDVRIYNVAIPTSQIKEQYYAGLNNLLTSGGITKEDYQNRIDKLAMGL